MEVAGFSEGIGGVGVATVEVVEASALDGDSAGVGEQALIGGVEGISDC